MLLSAITMVKNEEEFVGYVIMSMYDYVDEIIVVDGGSEDGTVDIIQYIMKELDKDNKITYWQDLRPKNELIHTRNDMIKACKGKWILRLEGDEVYSDENAKKVREYIEKGIIKDSVLSVGWPYYFFVNDINTIVPVGEPHTFATIMIKNVEGIHAAHHDRGGNETFYDEGWFDKDGKEVSIWHPKDNPTQRIKDIAIHHYAGFKRTTRHKDYMLKCKKVPFKEGHPEVFLRYDFKSFMKYEGSKEVIKLIEKNVNYKPKKTLWEKIRKKLKGY
ncbi:glycosyltransferase family 2 protein [Hippea jasoniae]|uniref:glycosyltransferase family 2 protein n=1 Tax=Hippea jasoniae TaxID=944479 RepID=UPI00055365D7|nr:glycosyltransferase family 2 protein [Hippea jasoniae]